MDEEASSTVRESGTPWYIHVGWCRWADSSTLDDAAFGPKKRSFGVKNTRHMIPEFSWYAFLFDVESTHGGYESRRLFAGGGLSS
jgi:hypothetical protein